MEIQWRSPGIITSLSSGYSATGFRPAWRHESALRGSSLNERLIRFAFWLGRDPVGDEPHRLSRRARDLVLQVFVGDSYRNSLVLIIDHLS